MDPPNVGAAAAMDEDLPLLQAHQVLPELGLPEDGPSLQELQLQLQLRDQEITALKERAQNAEETLEYGRFRHGEELMAAARDAVRAAAAAADAAADAAAATTAATAAARNAVAGGHIEVTVQFSSALAMGERSAAAAETAVVAGQAVATMAKLLVHEAKPAGEQAPARIMI